MNISNCYLLRGARATVPVGTFFDPEQEYVSISPKDAYAFGCDNPFYIRKTKGKYKILSGDMPYYPSYELSGLYHDEKGHLKTELMADDIVEYFYPVKDFLKNAKIICQTVRPSHIYYPTDTKAKDIRHLKDKYDKVSRYFVIASDGQHVLVATRQAGKTSNSMITNYAFLPANFIDRSTFTPVYINLASWGIPGGVTYVGDMKYSLDKGLEHVVGEICENFVDNMAHVIKNTDMETFAKSKAPEELNQRFGTNLRRTTGDFNKFNIRRQDGRGAQIDYCDEILYREGYGEECSLIKTKTAEYVSRDALPAIYINSKGQERRDANENSIKKEFYGLDEFYENCTPILRNAELSGELDKSVIGTDFYQERYPVFGEYFLVAHDNQHLLAYDKQREQYVFLPKAFNTYESEEKQGVWTTEPEQVLCNGFDEKKSVFLHLCNVCQKETENLKIACGIRNGFSPKTTEKKSRESVRDENV